MQAKSYRVVVRGRLSDRFVAAFDDIDIVAGAGATTSLTGSFDDPAEVYRVLDRLRDLGIELVRVDALR